MARRRHIVTRSKLRARPQSGDQLAGVIGGSGGFPKAVGISTLGFQRVSKSVSSDASGDATLRFGPPPAGQMWELESVMVQVAGSPGSAASVYVGEISSTALIAGTSRGDLDTAANSPAAYVPGGAEVFVVWAGAGSGNLCTAILQYRVGMIS